MSCRSSVFWTPAASTAVNDPPGLCSHSGPTLLRHVGIEAWIFVTGAAENKNLDREWIIAQQKKQPKVCVISIRKRWLPLKSRHDAERVDFVVYMHVCFD